MSSKIQVRKVTDPADLEKVFAIRREVFVGEQNCPPELEWEFEDESNHFLATVDGEPAGASRWRKTDKGYKLERFAVLEKIPGKGVGQELVKAVLADLLQMPLTFICTRKYRQYLYTKSLILKRPAPSLRRRG